MIVNGTSTAMSDSIMPVVPSPMLAMTKPFPLKHIQPANVRYIKQFEEIIFVQRKPASTRRRDKYIPALKVEHSNPVTGCPMKLYARPNDNPSQIYRTQLAASLRAFQQKQWPPLNHQELETNYIRCKPVQPIPPVNERPATSCSGRGGSPARVQRPKSVPPQAIRPKSGRRSDTPDVRPGNFDTLSPTIISDLMAHAERPPSARTITSISDRQSGPGRRGSSTGTSETSHTTGKSPFVDEIVAESQRLIPDNDVDDTSTTSGIDSGASDNESGSSSDDEDSDFEPDIDENITIPQLNLRPEKLDSVFTPEPKRGWRQYDFDMSTVEVPAFEFANPFPDYMEDLDLRQMAKLKWNWRNHVKVKKPREPDLEGILDRLVEFERLQLDTMDWENKRASQMRRSSKRNSAKSLLKDKRCDSSCLQSACFGDCPEKLVQSANGCDTCRQSYCTGNCKETKYEQRMRQPRMDDDRPITPKSPFPRACSSCQKRHNAKFLNANNLVIGTQRFNNVTYTRGQGSVKTKDIRPKTPSTLSKDMLEKFEKLNMEIAQPSRPNTAMSVTSRPRSRNSMLPGKSFSSQRKNSLTDLDKVCLPKKKRSKSSSKVKRPKTAG